MPISTRTNLVSRRPAVSLLLTLALGIPTANEAQEPPGPLRATLQTVLGDTAGPGVIPGMVRSVALDGTGQYWVSVYQAEPPLVFSPSGRFLFPAGRKGDGPGEFNGELQLHAGSDGRVFVLDGGLGRLTEMSPRGGYVDSRRLVAPTFRDFAMAPDGWAVVTGSMPTATLVGLPLHLYAPDRSAPVRSFGVHGAVAVRPGLGPLLDRAVTVDPHHRILALRRAEPVVEVWSLMGDSLDTWHLHAPWFLPTSSSRTIPRDRTPEPQFVDVRSEGDVVWVTALVPEARWERGFEFRADRPPGREWAVHDASKVFDTIVLKLSNQGRVLTSLRLDDVAPLLLGDMQLASLETYVGSGHPVVRIWKLFESHRPGVAR